MNTERIHIVGPPRSGTTLMQVLFATGFDIDGMTTQEESLWRRGPRGERILVTKCPGDEELASLLLPLDRHLWVVFMLRDPRDVVVSEHGQEPGKHWSNLRVWRQALKVHAKMKDHPRFIVVRYEDLVTAPDAMQRQLVRRMPFLKPIVPFSRYHQHLGEPVAQSEQFSRAMRGVRPITPENIATWRGHLPRVKAQLALHGGIAADLIEMGYERDNSWLGLLDNIPADEEQSLVPDQLPPRRRIRRASLRWLRMVRYLYRRYLYNSLRRAYRGTADAFASALGEKSPLVVPSDGFAPKL